MGRHLEQNGSAVLAYPGIEVTIRFRGASLSMKGEILGANSHYNVTLDGIDLPRLDLAEGPFSLTIASGLDEQQTHVLRLTRRNEAWLGQTRIDSFTTSEGGAFLPSEDEPERKLLFIGDSITCGEKADLTGYVEVDSRAWNAEHSFGWFLAKDFGSAVHLVSYGGRGLIRDWQGDSSSINAPEFFERTVPDSPEPLWDHSAYHPDLVVVGLGTNDFSRGIPERDEFVAAYIAFAERIREAHPAAKILLLSGPWFAEGDPKREALNRYLSETVLELQKDGSDYARAHFFARTYPGTERDAHPTAIQHRAMADDIRRTVSDWLGW